MPGFKRDTERRVVLAGNGAGDEDPLPRGADGDRLRLTVIGSLTADLRYADRCRAQIAASPTLAQSVCLRGALTEAETRAVLADSELLLSASSMESYGMVLAEARVAGVPILACAAGNASALVDRDAGGQLFGNAAQLARGCLELTQDRARLERCIAQARAGALEARPWLQAAREFLAHAENLEK